MELYKQALYLVEYTPIESVATVGYFAKGVPFFVELSSWSGQDELNVNLD